MCGLTGRSPAPCSQDSNQCGRLHIAKDDEAAEGWSQQQFELSVVTRGGVCAARSTLLLDGPYDETFFERLKDLSLEDDGSVEYAVTKIQQYRVAMTAKDCSIMIALSPTVQEECFNSRPLIKASRSSFMHSVSILDLDLKPYENIPYQHKRDSKIVTHYLKSLQSREEPSTSLIFPERDDCTLLLHQV
ncbi:inositol-pentakisphosphate 2-kinase-like [Anomaloglossus baeobatrachus]|uniref:inositol-pentakisphosphate 2-kinase-like n=1 Tax=Anomaloglossus baeobatrachus TaxID=238106 RepID=UPI003F50A093